MNRYQRDHTIRYLNKVCGEGVVSRHLVLVVALVVLELEVDARLQDLHEVGEPFLPVVFPGQRVP